METETVIKYGVIGTILLVLFLWIWPFSSVPTGTRGVVTQFGAIKGIEQEGLVVLPPWQNINIFSIRAETSDIENAQGSTSDTQLVTVDMTVRYSIAPDKVAEVYEKYSHDGDLSSYVSTATQEVFKAVTAKYNAVSLVSKRPQVSADIYEALGKKLEIYGAKVINIDMRNFEFSKEYMAAINEKVTQEQKKLAAENRALTVEAEQKAQVIEAEATAKSVRAKADGDAYATVTNAKAAAESLRIQNEALAQNREVLELRRIEVDMEKAQRWNGVLPVNVYAGTPIPFLNNTDK